MLPDLPEGVVPSTWKGTGNVWVHPNHEDNSVDVLWSLGREDGRRGELRVWYEGAPGEQVATVRLTLPDGLRPSTLSRFPWARWLAVADSAARYFDQPDPEAPESDHLTDVVEAARDGRRPPRAEGGGRPGRRGYPDGHYVEIATRYAELRMAGVRNPTATIAEERCVNRNTVAGWLRGARRRGFLPPARPGKAG
ncbi:MAG TPA: hypothetical protein VKA05_07365 [Acidimicrobiales bacterium]|nr:hypothetical protein [Acidimicrobiales bacterium]